jgi:hypothetical protein
MLSAADAGTMTQALRHRVATVLLLCAAGFALTLTVFYPGIMTFDAAYVYADIAKHFRGDWQSPVMTSLWQLIDPLAPGSASMFLFTVSLYWIAMALIGLTLARRSWLAAAVPILAATPPAFCLVGVIWRDVLFAVVWLFAAALVFMARDNGRWTLRAAQVAALLLLALGVLLRPNAVPAAPLLAAYILWPADWTLRRSAILYPLAFAAFVALVPFVYYGALDAKRQHPLHSLFVFDLGGITYFTKENQFPADWTPEQTALLTERCYPTDKWDTYWFLEPCRFVMARLEGDKIFGSDAMLDAWRKAVLRRPLAYLRHRATFMWRFLTGDNLVMWTEDIQDRGKRVLPDRAAFTALVAVQDASAPLWLFKPGLWLLSALLLCGLAWPRRATPSGAFVLGVGGSAAVYVASYFAVGVASDYRYAYWAAVAVLCSAPVLIAGNRDGSARQR